jgi:hypothetical protein
MPIYPSSRKSLKKNLHKKLDSTEKGNPHMSYLE